jgi:GntR family transcriptional regulator
MYLQLVEQVRHAIELGALAPGDQLPGIRKVAEDLVMNPNTVAKAYREMEHAGLIVLRHGSGAFVAETASGNSTENRRAMQKGRTILHRTVGAMRNLGLDGGAIRRLLESELAETEGDD